MLALQAKHSGRFQTGYLQSCRYRLYRRHILDSFRQEYLQIFRYHMDNAPLCPVFNLDNTVGCANEFIEKMAVKVN